MARTDLLKMVHFRGRHRSHSVPALSGIQQSTFGRCCVYLLFVYKCLCLLKSEANQKNKKKTIRKEYRKTSQQTIFFVPVEINIYWQQKKNEKEKKPAKCDQEVCYACLYGF